MTFQGSSPHTRGAHLKPDYVDLVRGIIPAYAGSTPTHWWPPPERSDHPRIRGEHNTAASNALSFSGSSPHTRGALLRLLHSRARRGIIPAYAGSTPRPGAGQSPAADHPRIRGEHEGLADELLAFAGSSPHTRGARREPTRRKSQTRIIPAYAGSTRPAAGRTRWPSDHPRIRGEHDGLPIAEWRRAGSSPHTRGAPQLRGFLEVPGYIIPAYAGSTSGPVDQGLAGVGSSPHTRGARSACRTRPCR